MKAFNNDLLSQVSSLETILLKNPFVKSILHHVDSMELPQWYLGGGCIAQTVWNYLSNEELTRNINDYDLAYFDQDLSYESENRHVANIREAFNNLPIQIDVKNQARAHLWYEEHFGYSIDDYQSVEETINTWPTTATCVGVKYIEGVFTVYAPYGLNDLFGMIIKPNKLQITKEIYLKKVKRWKECWPKLKIVQW